MSTNKGREPSLHKVNGQIFMLVDYLACTGIIIPGTSIVRVAFYLATPIESVKYVYNPNFELTDEGEKIIDAELLRLWPHRLLRSKHGWRSTDTILYNELVKRGYYLHNKKWVKQTAD